MVDNSVNGRNTLHSWDFIEYHLWMICFQCEELTVGYIILRSWDLSEYHLWMMHFDAERALWWLTSTTDTAVAFVMLCSWELWSWCTKLNFIWRFWKHFNSLRTEWKLLILSGSLLRISSRLESSLPFAQKQGCRLSRRPQKGQRLIFPFFCEICFSLWFRSDALSVSPEPELQTHCVFQSFLFLF